jgi:type IX secretion system PorP/SprF family membrane protein
MKKLILTALVFFLFLNRQANAQVEPLFRHYMFNKQLYNPAAAGEEQDFISARSIYDFYFIAPGSPDYIRTSDFSAAVDGSVPIGKKFQIGFGGQYLATSDGFSSSNRFTGSIAFGFPLKICDSGILNIGINAGFYNESFTSMWNDLIVEPDRPAYPWVTNYKADAGAGVYYHNPRFYFGISTLHIQASGPAFNIVSNSKDFGFYSNVIRTYVFNAGYNFQLRNKDFQLQPSVILMQQYLPATAYTPALVITPMALSGLLMYKERYWGGVNIQHDMISSISVMAGMKIKTKIGEARIGYSYDIATQIPVLAGGMHELMLSLHANVKKGEGLILK